MLEDEPMVRINIIIPESKRERFFDHCRRLKPKRASMNAALNAVIDGVLAGSISLSELLGNEPAKKPRR